MMGTVRGVCHSMTKIIAIATMAMMPAAMADCFHDASVRYGPPEKLLKAIARVESSNRPRIINYNKDGSYDIGIMQVNSRWLLKLGRWGLDKNSLLDACTNINVGAWILAQNIQRMGYNWGAIGAYNAASTSRRYLYERRVSNALADLN